MYKHPSLSGLPALLLLPFLPTLQEHKFLAVAPFAGVLMQETPLSEERNIWFGQFH